jgi:GT2 family glycosyltransferase
MQKNKIGLGLITCDRPEFFLKSHGAIKDNCDISMCVVDDGTTPIRDLIDFGEDNNTHYIRTNGREGAGKAKNKAFKYLLEIGCEHIFLLEDDIIIKDQNVFNEYINARNKTGIQHFMFGYHGPANKAGISGGKPVPRYVIDYGDIKIAINLHSVGAFCYYSAQSLNEVGLIDEQYINAFDHVDHDYRLAKAGYSSPYWNWADLANSTDYLEEIECSEKSSTIRPNKDWAENIQKGAEYFFSKHGVLPAWQNAVPDTQFKDLKKILKDIHSKHSIK